MFIIPLLIAILFLGFELIYDSTIYLNSLGEYILKLGEDDKGLEVQVSKQAMKETAGVVSDGINKFAVNVGGYGTAAAAAAGIQKVATSGAPLGAKAVGIIGLSVIATTGALSPAISKFMTYTKEGTGKSNNDTFSNSFVYFEDRSGSGSRSSRGVKSFNYQDDYVRGGNSGKGKAKVLDYPSRGGLRSRGGSGLINANNSSGLEHNTRSQSKKPVLRTKKSFEDLSTAYNKESVKDFSSVKGGNQICGDYGIAEDIDVSRIDNNPSYDYVNKKAGFFERLNNNNKRRFYYVVFHEKEKRERKKRKKKEK